MCQIPVKQLMWVTACQREDQLPNLVNQTINSWLVIVVKSDTGMSSGSNQLIDRCLKIVLSVW